MGLHLVKGDGNLRTEKMAVIFNFGGILGGIPKIYVELIFLILNSYIVIRILLPIRKNSQKP